VAAADPIIESMELAAAVAGDITGAVYERYYDACPAAGELMAHVDNYMQGRMMDELLRLLMTDDLAAEQGYLNFEVANHCGYRVAANMYPDLLDAIHGVVRDAVGTRWSDAFERAWSERVTSLLGAIEERTSGVVESE
jgi:hypothetical protein